MFVGPPGAHCDLAHFVQLGGHIKMSEGSGPFMMEVQMFPDGQTYPRSARSQAILLGALLLVVALLSVIIPA
jgi:hypothetical protein